MSELRMVGRGYGLNRIRHIQRGSLLSYVNSEQDAFGGLKEFNGKVAEFRTMEAMEKRPGRFLITSYVRCGQGGGNSEMGDSRGEFLPQFLLLIKGLVTEGGHRPVFSFLTFS
ncbi:hypothetical protein Zmor_026628 [Zophobas morio]|mgnify:FL=1|uniref:Uncharacterized protein n=1 Tax=Zophobas morio TaxID=2755281 RepID=A0AA38HU65_9CUCU|nr:hypothetical protein Zmor_026628 [Zophobas morio]